MISKLCDLIWFIFIWYNIKIYMKYILSITLHYKLSLIERYFKERFTKKI